MAYKLYKFLYHSSGCQKSKRRMPAGWDLLRNPLPGCRLLTSHCIFTWWREERGRNSWVTHKGTNPIHKGPILMTSSHPNYFLKTPLLNTITWEVGVEFQHMNFGGYKHFIHKESKILPNHRGLVNILGFLLKSLKGHVWSVRNTAQVYCLSMS